jgi:hypothetical protein
MYLLSPCGIQTGVFRFSTEGWIGSVFTKSAIRSKSWSGVYWKCAPVTSSHDRQPLVNDAEVPNRATGDLLGDFEPKLVSSNPGGLRCHLLVYVWWQQSCLSRPHPSRLRPDRSRPARNLLMRSGAANYRGEWSLEVWSPHYRIASQGEESNGGGWGQNEGSLGVLCH